MNGKRNFFRRGRGVGAGVLLALLAGFASPPAGAQTFRGPQPPEHLSWYGDPGAPDISGVWKRADDQGKAVAGDPEGWRPWPAPLKGAFADIWKTRLADAAAGKRTDDPVRGCMPPGMPRFITGDNSPLLIIQSHGRVTMQRGGEGARRIWADGRPPPQAGDIEPFIKGTSVGRYEGQDLIVETVGLKDQPIDSTGAPHSDQLKITERYHRIDPQHLKVEVTLTDAKAYSRPLSTTVFYTAVSDPEWTPQEFICTPQTDYHPDRYVH